MNAATNQKEDDSSSDSSDDPLESFMADIEARRIAVVVDLVTCAVKGVTCD